MSLAFLPYFTFLHPFVTSLTNFKGNYYITMKVLSATPLYSPSIPCPHSLIGPNLPGQNIKLALSSFYETSCLSVKPASFLVKLAPSQSN